MSVLKLEGGVYWAKHIQNAFLCPRDHSQGALRFAPVCPSVRPSVRHALRYRVCVINSSHSFKWISSKPCIPVVDILKMCMWVFGGARINSNELGHMTNMATIPYMVKTLKNLLLQKQ